MTTKGTALAVQPETWPEYVLRVTSGVSRKDIARAAGINVSGVSRWVTGASRPSAEKVVAFARGLRLNPVEALVAAGYLEATEIDGAVEVVRARSQLSDQELLTELSERLARLGGGTAAWHNSQDFPGSGTPPDWRRAAGEEPGMFGEQNRGERYQGGC